MVIIETADRRENVIRPSMVQLTPNGQTMRSFGKFEVEVTAGRLVQFFREKDYWGVFRLTELFEFYRLNGWDPDTMLFGLIGRWHDDGGTMIHWPSSQHLGMASDGSVYVTKEFVAACARSVAHDAA